MTDNQVFPLNSTDSHGNTNETHGGGEHGGDGSEEHGTDTGGSGGDHSSGGHGGGDSGSGGHGDNGSGGGHGDGHGGGGGHGGHEVVPPSYQLQLHSYSYRPHGFSIFTEEIAPKRYLIGFYYSVLDHYDKYIFRLRYNCVHS